jgi:hypothetical protein
MDVQTLISATALVTAAQQGTRVAWLTDGGEVVYGTARRIVGDQVEESSLEVTTFGGMEVTFPLMDLVTKYRSGYFVINPTLPE